MQGTDILMKGTVFRHNKYILAFQYRTGGKRIGDLNWHRIIPLYGLLVSYHIMSEISMKT